MRIVIALAFAVGLVGQAAVPRVWNPDLSEARGLADWEVDGNGTWHMRGGVLALDKEGVPAGPIRRPGAMAILKAPIVGSFTLQLDVKSTAPVDLLVRDVLLIFGYQSPTRLYYVHLAAKTDGVHNGIFLVDNADRRRLDQPTSTARLTDQAWHRVRLERDTTSGAIRVFFDDAATPMLTTTDTTILSGRVGVGSFDETGEFRGIELRTSGT